MKRGTSVFLIAVATGLLMRGSLSLIGILAYVKKASFSLKNWISMTSSFYAIRGDGVAEKILQVVGNREFSFYTSLWCYVFLPRDSDLLFWLSWNEAFGKSSKIVGGCISTNSCDILCAADCLLLVFRFVSFGIYFLLIAFGVEAPFAKLNTVAALFYSLQVLLL